MRYLIHLVVTVLVGFPALAAGYLWQAISIGWDCGKMVYDQHDDAAIEKWLP